MQDPNALVEANQQWAYGIARTIHQKVSASFDINDLEQIALIATWEQAQKFDPTRNIPFQGYAYPAVHGAVMMKVRGANWKESKHDALHERDDLAPKDLRPNPEEAAINQEIMEAAPRLSRPALRRSFGCLCGHGPYKHEQGQRCTAVTVRGPCSCIGFVRCLCCKCGHYPQQHKNLTERCEVCVVDKCGRSVPDPALVRFWSLVKRMCLPETHAWCVISGAEDYHLGVTLRENVATINRGEEIQEHKDMKAQLEALWETDKPEKIPELLEEIRDAEQWGASKDKHRAQALEAAGHLERLLGEVLHSPTLRNHYGIGAEAVTDIRDSLVRFLSSIGLVDEYRKSISGPPVDHMDMPRVALARLAMACSGDYVGGRKHVKGAGWRLIALAIYLASGKTIHTKADTYRKNFSDWLKDGSLKIACVKVGIGEDWSRWSQDPKPGSFDGVV